MHECIYTFFVLVLNEKPLNDYKGDASMDVRKNKIGFRKGED